MLDGPQMTASLETLVSESSPPSATALLLPASQHPCSSRLSLFPVSRGRKLAARGEITYSQVHLARNSLRKASVQAGPVREPILFPVQHQASYRGRYAGKMASANHVLQKPRL